MNARINSSRGRAIVWMLGFVVFGATAAEAQRWGRPRPPRAGACFYQNANYGGDYFCIAAGEDLDQMPSGLNDRISSIRTFGDAEVTVFRNPGFSGRSTRFAGDVSNLQLEGWNDTLSSLSVRRRGFGGGNGGGWGGGGGGWGGGGGGNTANVDRMIRRAYQDMLGREPDQAGLREYRRQVIDEGWGEAEVREAIRRSPEYRERNTMSRERAEEIVRQAYLSVLGREPDPGAQSYVDRVLRQRWSQQDVERELRRSPEYRNRRPGR
jgi:hypothetical protein